MINQKGRVNLDLAPLAALPGLALKTTAPSNAAHITKLKKINPCGRHFCVAEILFGRATRRWTCFLDQNKMWMATKISSGGRSAVNCPFFTEDGRGLSGSKKKGKLKNMVLRHAFLLVKETKYIIEIIWIDCGHSPVAVNLCGRKKSC